MRASHLLACLAFFLLSSVVAVCSQMLCWGCTVSLFSDGSDELDDEDDDDLLFSFVFLWFGCRLLGLPFA